ncbi:hypothetical protein BC829DRAFT_382268 [Chytridium lagenaria]|nr:hypothetical protein BC829DRAFT_382268 [Chytridium lagenaria]
MTFFFSVYSVFCGLVFFKSFPSFSPFQKLFLFFLASLFYLFIAETFVLGR